MKRLFTSLLWLALGGSLMAQTEALLIEAEAGSIGADYSTQTEEDVTYLAIQTNGTQQYPESADRVLTYEITFPAAGTYDLYLRFRVGSGAFDDDSYFIGNGFGSKSPTEANDWLTMNQLASVGYVAESDVVRGTGAASTEVWKWLNFSEFTQGEGAITFEVDASSLTQTLQIGAREDGFEIDKLAFGLSDYFYTVANLNLGEAGSQDSASQGGRDPIAEGEDKFLGNIYSTSQIAAFTEYWNQVTPENAGKWGSVEATRDQMNWTALDAAYALAKDNGYPFRFHVLVWGNQQPAWIENLPANEQLAEIEEWYQAVADRYPDLDMIEVVNEPINDPPNQAGDGGGNYIDALGGSGDSGWDWIKTAFELARQYFPNSILALNEYNIVNNASNAQTYKEIAEILLADSLIDAIGVQAHAFSLNVSNSAIEANLNRLAATGLPLYITEMDVDGPDDQLQLLRYQRIFPLFWEHPAVAGVTLWGWRTGMWRTDQMAYLMETDGVTERPSLVWLRDYVNGTLSIEQPGSQAQPAFRVYPNPWASGSLHLVGTDGQLIQSVEVFDLQGRRLAQVLPEVPTESLRLDLTLSPGLYTLRISSRQGVETTRVQVR